MITGSIRRAQLVSPFGVGAMSVLVDGTSVITAGLDHWYPKPGEDADFSLDEFVVHDWRLEERLMVGSFRLPPDYRAGHSDDDRNRGLHVPVLRFPRWHFCIYCKRLRFEPLTMRQPVLCPDDKHKDAKRPPRMSQVPFVAICSHGHIDDFPFREWVHRTSTPTCQGVLRLTSRGGGSLEGQVVICDDCHMERSLQGVMDARIDAKDRSEHTTLTDRLSSDGSPFFCTGARPWLQEEGGSCGESLRGALRAAGNVYFPTVESSIYLPRKIGAVSEELHDLFRQANVSTGLTMLHALEESGVVVSADVIRNANRELLSPFGDQELLDAYADRFGGDVPPTSSHMDMETLTANEEWRLPEFELLRETPTDELLCAIDPGLPMPLANHLDRARQVTGLRETRTLRGFTRVRDSSLRLSEGKALLRRRPFHSSKDDWLPAYVVKGEGIYLELGTSRLTAWETRADVIQRAALINDRYRTVVSARGMPQRQITPRFVLLHTLAHLLINQLVFTCGYSSASLRERLYVSNVHGKEMAGLLIYTAAGDSEGTLGGLVRMATQEHLSNVFDSAINAARWCSTDPVCMDAGEKGQGPDSCNLAACHGCALLPETACEEFNRFLDRGLVIGTFDRPDLGYFSDYGV